LWFVDGWLLEVEIVEAKIEVIEFRLRVLNLVLEELA